MKRVLVLGCGFLLGWGGAVAQDGPRKAEGVGLEAATVHGADANAAIVFSMVPRLTTVAPWRIALSQEGTGTYTETAETAGKNAIPVRASADVMRKLAGGAGAVESQACETKKKIAQTGLKTIAYARGGAEVKCTFNYSDDEGLNDAANVFIAMATTMQYGARLQHEHRFDRLGLAAEMDSLVAAVKDGRAIEVGNIAGVLQSLVDDEEVIGVVRRRAQALLAGPVSR